VTHIQKTFAEQFIPEQNLLHDEAMIKYFGKSSLKQSLRMKPIRFGFKAWVLCTPSGYVVCFQLYQGKSECATSEANVKAVGAAGASLLDLMDMLPGDKKLLAYHIFADNFFSSQKLVDFLIEQGNSYTGTIRKDRVKGDPPLTKVEPFKKKPRGYHETVVMEDESCIITR